MIEGDSLRVAALQRRLPTTCRGGAFGPTSLIDAQAVVLMMLPSALLRLCSAELTPLEAPSTLAINPPLPDAEATLAKAAAEFPALVGLWTLNKAADWLPLMPLIDMMFLGEASIQSYRRGLAELEESSQFMSFDDRRLVRRARRLQLTPAGVSPK